MDKDLKKAEDYLKLYGNLNIYDVKQLFCYNSSATQLYKKIAKHLDENFDFIDGKTRGDKEEVTYKTWYYKPLKKYVCMNCKKPFKSTTRQLYCCNACRKVGLEKKEQELNFLK